MSFLFLRVMSYNADQINATCRFTFVVDFEMIAGLGGSRAANGEKNMSDYKRLEIYTINKKDGQEKGYWCRIGTAFVNKDGSINGIFDALPVNGTIHIREPKEREDDGGQRSGGRSNYNQSSGKRSGGQEF